MACFTLLVALHPVGNFGSYCRCQLMACPGTIASRIRSTQGRKTNLPAGQKRMNRNSERGNKGHTGPGYLRFFAMIATSTVVMFGLMYLNTYALDHVFFSQTRMWMALYMGAVMAVIMLSFMLGMYSNRRINMAIFAGAAVAFAMSLWLVRSQATVADIAWMEAMIPHHSIAILTSERADISDPRVKALAEAIIEAQRGEIEEMKRYITDIEANGDAAPGTPRDKS